MNEPKVLEFEVTGTAIPQGSVAYHPVLGPDGEPLMRGGRPVLRSHHQSKKLKPWRARVAANARLAMRGRRPFTGAIALAVTVCRRRPKEHYDSRGRIKETAPEYPITRPDTLKQARGVEDAMTRIVWLDDSQVVEHYVLKMFARTPKVFISVRRKD